MLKVFGFAIGLTLSASLALAKGAQPMDGPPKASTAPAAARPGTLDPASAEALQKTQDLLRDPTQRQEALKADPKAMANDQKVRSALGDQTDKAYELSAQLMEVIVQKSNGDPKKMQDLVNQLMANPQMLEQYLTPAQRAQISKMASDMEAKKGMAPVSPGK